MTIDTAIQLQLGDFSREVIFAATAPITALIAPSGAGKTSTLLAIAGLLRPQSGHIRVAGRTLFDSAAGVDVPARDRNLGVVFQDGRLFPHLTVRANLGYANRAIPAEITAMAETLGIAPLLSRWPRHLSGGEARRVALGRALLSRPAALLLDEPLAHLDPMRADTLLGLIADIDVPMLYVTHDMREAERLRAQIIGL